MNKSLFGTQKDESLNKETEISVLESLLGENDCQSYSENLFTDRSLRNDHSFIKNVSPINSELKCIQLQNKETIKKAANLQATQTRFIGQIGYPQ